MPNNVHKSAAVPFVNQKGERSMKRVKVERYVAGKKPAYAKDDDEDEEFYITDDEDDGNYDEEQSEEEYKPVFSDVDRKISYQDSDEESEEQDGGQPGQAEHEEDDDDDDDPRFRRLKEVESKSSVNKLIEKHPVETSDIKHQENRLIIDNDDDEEEIKRRHRLARSKQIEEPIGSKAIFNDVHDEPPEYDLDLENSEDQQKRLDTDDLLKDLKLTGLKPAVLKKTVELERAAEQQRLLEALDQAKQEAVFESQINKKIEEDIRKEREREALAKGDVGAHDMSSVKTDDEDDEMAYEEWKLREIKRVLRDRSERMIERANKRPIGIGVD